MESKLSQDLVSYQSPVATCRRLQSFIFLCVMPAVLRKSWESRVWKILGKSSLFNLLPELASVSFMKQNYHPASAL